MIETRLPYDLVPMHERCIDWGNIRLRGGGPGAYYHEAREREYVEYNGKQIDDARVMHNMVCALIPQLRITLMVFYKLDAASDWWGYSTITREVMQRAASLEISNRLRDHMRDTGQWQRSIRPIELIPIRDRGLRALVEREGLKLS